MAPAATIGAAAVGDDGDGRRRWAWNCRPCPRTWRGPPARRPWREAATARAWPTAGASPRLMRVLSGRMPVTTRSLPHEGRRRAVVPRRCRCDRAGCSARDSTSTTAGGTSRAIGARRSGHVVPHALRGRPRPTGAWKGCTPVIISTSTTDSAHTSSCSPAASPSTASGDRYSGVPASPGRLDACSRPRAPSCVQRVRPKSSSLGTPARPNPMLLGLMSRCSQPRACSASSASASRDPDGQGLGHGASGRPPAASGQRAARQVLDHEDRACRATPRVRRAPPPADAPRRPSRVPRRESSSTRPGDRQGSVFSATGRSRRVSRAR